MPYVSTNKTPAELFLNRKLHRLDLILLQKQNKNQTNNTRSN